jgi:hypothetical protein
VLVHESEAEAVSSLSVRNSRKMGVIYQPDLGFDNRQKSFLEENDEYDTTEAFKSILSDAKRGRKRDGAPRCLRLMRRRRPRYSRISGPG